MADLDFCDSMVGGPTSTFLKNTGLIIDLAVGVSSPADLAGGVTVGVVLSAIAEVESSADIAEVASSADLAGDVTVSVTSSAVAEVASLADIADVASWADLAEVASSADFAEVVSSADLARDVTVGVTSSADPACVVTAGVAFHKRSGGF